MTIEDRRRIGVRLLCLIALVPTVVVLAACGGRSGPAAAPGSPQKPLTGQPTQDKADAPRVNEAGTAGKGASSAADDQPGYQKLLEAQSRKPESRFSPCNLVSRAQARAFVGRQIADVVEAPQGPTCIYRSADKTAGYVTLAVQSQSLASVRRHLRKQHAVAVGGRSAVCGTYGQPMLYASVSGGRVLSIAAPCPVAKRFATTALRRLTR
jgi:hypothetical protein